ncbi:unnamed protein product [Haemonchus placei]|uniref:DM10 domain-containing protein n=1 Tax=Haemonchus placei TaxID=6290 RepID=A0A0N4XBG1_HAEPC|nr:unnamed protein product [Haemonchus placei]
MGMVYDVDGGYLFGDFDRHNLQLVQHRDQSLSYSAFMMANPPIKNVMRFYFFNVTNPDEMIYYGEKPRLVESQSYAVM